MDRQYRKTPSRTLWLVIALVVLGSLLAAAMWFWFKKQDAQLPAADKPTTETSKVTKPIASPKVIDLDNLKNNAQTQSLMERRKQEYGVQSGVDAIVKSDESITVGGITIPMSEILDKIRLKKGHVIEKDLNEAPDHQRDHRNRKLLYERLAKAEEAYRALEKKLTEPDIQNNPELYDQYSKRLAELKKIVELYQRLKALDARIDAHKQRLEGLAESEKTDAREHLNRLLDEKKKLEAQLKALVMPSGEVEAYGIYVVRPGDNIWNIHFVFLRDYFGHKGIALSQLSDEPDRQGFSSGVGKILKFSENMVYIYNIRQRKLDVNLNLIHPRSKIVVFNMGEAFSLLDQIDYRNVKQIKFDGETLWIPAEQ